jgi:hypothetical protein
LYRFSRLRDPAIENEMYFEESIPCEHCGATATVVTGERPDSFGWYANALCPACRGGYNEDSWYHASEVFAPGRVDKFRDRVIAAEGEWALVLASAVSIELLKAFRSLLQLSLVELMALKKQLPGVLVRGTKTELEILRALLLECGVRDIMTLTRL